MRFAGEYIVYTVFSLLLTHSQRGSYEVAKRYFKAQQLEREG